MTNEYQRMIISVNNGESTFSLRVLREDAHILPDALGAIAKAYNKRRRKRGARKAKK